MTGEAWNVERALAFFAARRASSFGRLTGRYARVRVASIERLVSKMVEDPRWLSVPHIAYGLATTHHECAGRYEPIEEFASGEAYEGRVDLGNVEEGDGVRFKGRGFVQLTGRANYVKATALLRRLGIRMDLVAEPDLAMQWEAAYAILTHGMYGDGLTFTGKKLPDFDLPGGFDYRRARRIINAMDRADLIAGYSKAYEWILERALGT